MNFDRNTIMGFIVMALLFLAYFWYNSKEQQAYLIKQKIEKAKQDSIANANKPKTDTTAAAIKQVVVNAENKKLDSAGGFQKAASGTEQLDSLQNDLIKVVFTTKGGQPKYVELKKFNDQKGNPVRLAGTSYDKFDYKINTGIGNAEDSANVTDFYFAMGKRNKNPDGSESIDFVLAADSADVSITHRFTVKPDNYMIDFNVDLKNAGNLFTQGIMNVTWQNQAKQTEKKINTEKENAHIGYVQDGEFDYHTIGMRSDKEFSKSVQWLCVKQRFFNTSLVAKNNFTSGKIEWTTPPDKDSTVVAAIANMRLQVPAGNTAAIPFSFYYGPTDYNILKKYDIKMEKMVRLSQGGMLSFVQYLNKWIVMPVFNFFQKYHLGMGLVIALLTIFIRLLTSPLMYPGYKTSAQMKLLRPDIAKLKEKYPEQQQFAMEQMKFMREAGVNQFAGCLPSLLQIPIFFALFSFFNSAVALRGESFLWARDLSSYDSIANFGFEVPFYGDHVSLFTITATITSFLISLYSMNMTPDQSNPVLKYMPYIFPIFLLFIFNKLPSALTWYYTVSNVITLLLQFVIQRYVINHDKLLAKIELNRKKPKTKSKWQEAMERMQEQQKAVKDQQRNKK
jgi:YidC/Oxa1 family membrane protein insertase